MHIDNIAPGACITRRGTSGRRFLAKEDGEDSMDGPLQNTYLAKSSAETSAEGSRWLLEKEKLRSQSTVEAKRARKAKQ